jgi:hypothetical protein
MKRAEQIRMLANLAQTVLDRQMADLRKAAAARAQTVDRLESLCIAPDAGTLPDVATARARVRYEAWADLRRRELNLVLARQTVAVLAAEDAAREAFGRRDVLRRLEGRKDQPS